MQTINGNIMIKGSPAEFKALLLVYASAEWEDEEKRNKEWDELMEDYRTEKMKLKESGNSVIELNKRWHKITFILYRTKEISDLKI